MEDLVDLFVAGPLEIEGDPAEAVLVGMVAEAGSEAADLAIDGGPVPSARLQSLEAAGPVPGHPEADQFGVLDDRFGRMVARTKDRPFLDRGVGRLDRQCGPNVFSGTERQNVVRRPSPAIPFPSGLSLGSERKSGASVIGGRNYATRL